MPQAMQVKILHIGNSSLAVIQGGEKGLHAFVDSGEDAWVGAAVGGHCGVLGLGEEGGRRREGRSEKKKAQGQ